MTEGTTWHEVRAGVTARLVGVGVSDPVSEAGWLLEAASGLARIELVHQGSAAATRSARVRLEALVARREAGEPLQYVLGEWSFRGLDLMVDRRVLIPRPETEVVVEVALSEAERAGLRRGAPDGWQGGPAEHAVADLGTGSGAIAIALASELPDVEVWATDTSVEAIAVARANLAGAGSAGARVRLAPGSWFDPLPVGVRGALRLVVANPPYVAECEVSELPSVVIEWEPRRALVSGPTGLEATSAVVAGASRWLAPAGTLVVEVAPPRARECAELARDAGLIEVVVLPDLAGRDRVLVAHRPG